MIVRILYIRYTGCRVRVSRGPGKDRETDNLHRSECAQCEETEGALLIETRRPGEM